MSTIAAMLVLYAAPAERVPMSAEAALAAHRAATSIGADACADPTGDEIVVCGRRPNAYALPVVDPTYDVPTYGDPATRYGGEGADRMAAIAQGQTACATQSWQCRPGPAFNGVKALDAIGKIFEALTDGE